MCVCACVCVCAYARSVMPDSATPWTVPSPRLFCPWDFPGKNTGLGCHFLHQGNFSTPGQNPHLLHLLHWHVGSLPLSHLGNHMYIYTHTSVTSILDCIAPERAVLSILLTTAMPDIQNKLNKCLLNAWKFLSLSCEKEVMFPTVPPHLPSFPSTS